MTMDPDPLLGAVLDACKLLEPIGRGGIGGVYRGLRLTDERIVAVKVLSERLAQDPEIVDRFRKGARDARRLTHPHVVQILDVGQCRGLHYLVMEYVDGPSVRQVMDNAGMWRNLAPQRVHQVAAHVASALVFAASQRIVHRDIKPANILLEGNGRAKLADLELARSLDDPEPSFAGRREGFLGTLPYMPLEQVLDPDSVDHRCDIYSLGATMYGMLTGRPPFLGTGDDLVDRISGGEFPDLRDLRPQVPDSFRAVIHKALSVYPEDRQQTPEDLAAALREVAKTERW